MNPRRALLQFPSPGLVLPHFRSRWIAAIQLLCTLFWTLQPVPVANSYQHDSNSDGIPEEHANPTDPNDDWWNVDSDGDLLSNADEVVFGSDPYSYDSDLDGITDRDERDITLTNPWQWDSDGDGYSDHDEFYNSTVVNYHDLVIQMIFFTSYYDADGDGAHNQDDSDPVNGSLWDDWDRNGVSDATDAANDYSMQDNDSDGYQNGSDSHSDDPSLWNDRNMNGYNDEYEGSDSDSDGIPDWYDSFPYDYYNGSPPPNGFYYNGYWYDGDWVDNDADGIPNQADSHPDDSNNGASYTYNGVTYTGTWWDSDNDGIPDPADTYPYDANNGGFYYNWNWYFGSPTDSDNDGIPDAADAYPNDPYNGHYSVDADGDGYVNAYDSHSSDTSLWNDWNNNGINDSAEPDSDGDGAIDSNDPYPNDPWDNGDRDGDGLTDLLEIGFGESQGLGTDPDLVDTDDDGLTDLEEVMTLRPGYPELDPLNAYSLNPVYEDGLMVDTTDTDGDGIPDAIEKWYAQTGETMDFENAADAQGDLDGDGIINLIAYQWGRLLTANRDQYDLDRDRITDIWEDAHPGILNKARFADAVEDYDQDGLINFEEFQLGFDPGNPHSWSPSVTDGQIGAWQRAIAVFGYYGWDEINLYGSSYLTPPEDHSIWSASGAYDEPVPTGYLTYTNWKGSDFPVGAAHPTDIDGDGMSNEWEHRYWLNLHDPEDAGPSQGLVAHHPMPHYNKDEWIANLPAFQEAIAGGEPVNIMDFYDATAHHASILAYEAIEKQDPDHDGLSNLREFILGTHPRMADTDGDGLNDGWEVAHGLNPKDLTGEADLDSDGDGVSNRAEALQYTDPLDAFNGWLPTLQIVGPSRQGDVADTLLPQAFTVRVLNKVGQVIRNAQILFSKSYGGGNFTISADGAASFSPTLSVSTNSDGLAAVYFKLGTVPGDRTLIVAKTGPAGREQQVTFLATTGDLSKPPLVAKNVNVERQSATSTLVTWEDHSDNEIGFHIERSEDNYTWQQVGSVAANITSFVDSNAPEENAPYLYRIATYNSSN